MDRVQGGVQGVAIGAQLGQVARAAAELGRGARGGRPGRFPAPARAPPSPRARARASPRSCAAASPRWSPRGRSRQHADQLLADGVVEAESRRRRSRGAEERAQRQVHRGRARPAPVEGAGDQLDPVERGQRRERVGDGAEQRVGAVAEGVQGGRAQRAPPGGWSSAVGSAMTTTGRSSRGAVRPSGRRWIAVISAPDIVVGIAQSRPSATAAMAFAVSITRPPPRATRSVCADSVEQLRPRCRRPCPAGPRGLRGGVDESGRRPRQRPRCGQELEGVPAAGREGVIRAGERPLPEADHARPVMPGELARVG